jgi:ATP-binding cassette, subfamily B, multidrug efflux pump
VRSLRRNAAALLRLLGQHLAVYRSWLGAIVVLQLVATMAALYLPTLNADIIDKGVAKGDTGYIVRTGGVMLGFSLVQVIFTVAAVYFASRVAMSVGRDVRDRLFRQVGSFSSREVARFGAPSLITRNTNDVQQVQMLVQMAGTFGVVAPIMMVGGVVMALRQDVGLAWLIVVSVAVLAIAAASIISQMVPAFRLMQTRIDAVNRILREQITGSRVVRAFVREPYETERFRVANRDLTTTAITAGRWMAAMFPTVMLILNVSIVGVLWFGGQRVDAGTLQVGSLVAFMNYLLQILMAVMMATFMLVMAPRASVSADRIVEVAETDSSVVPPADPVMSLPHRGELRLERVEFSYPGASAPVLRDVSFVARRGETTAIVGSTGSGKSTLLNLIPRLYDATGGVVRVDDVDVRRLDPELLWSTIGLVPQRAYLFSGTVRSNLQYGRPDATDQEMWAALSTAQARAFVEAMPGGLDASIAQGGTNVSGGQRQRLAIARALVKRADIYLFDDAFSALDVATDARLRRALKPITRKATVLIVAQRVSTILDADQILVLEHGEIVGRGTHRSLLADNETYQEIVRSQLTDEEAA